MDEDEDDVGGGGGRGANALMVVLKYDSTNRSTPHCTGRLTTVVSIKTHGPQITETQSVRVWCPQIQTSGKNFPQFSIGTHECSLQLINLPHS